MLLIRHGQTPTTGVELYGRKPGVHISDVGVGQAEKVADRISEMNQRAIAAIY